MIRLLPGFIGRAALWYYKIIEKKSEKQHFLVDKMGFYRYSLQTESAYKH